MSRINDILRRIGHSAQDIAEINQIANPAPPRKQEKGHFEASAEDDIHQMDLLMLPNDAGYKYALVVSDIASREFDAEPLKDKTPQTVLNALKPIYKRKYLKQPKYEVQTDGGVEFMGPVHQYFINDLKVRHRRALAGRHTQQAVVEYLNRELGRVLNRSMQIDRLNNRTPKWRTPLKHTIPILNEGRKRDIPDPFKLERLKP